MKRILLILCCFLAYQTLNAEGVSKSEALKKAQRFMPGKRFVEGQSVASTRGEASSEAFYVFNADNDGGFVIVSGDDRTTEILGYSKTGNLDMDRLPENLKWWLDGYVRQIGALGTFVKPAQTQRSKTRGSDGWKAIEPLIQTKWDQGTPYNLMCPDYKGRFIGDDGFATDDNGVYNIGAICVTGCVATAMAQMLYYWKYPDDTTIYPALDAYTTSSYGWSMKALPATSFKWDKMKKTYNGDETDESATAVAELFRYCGQSVNMNYSLKASEASVKLSALINTFGFSKNIRALYRDAYTTSQWEEIIYAELAAKRPVFYSGQAEEGGHQFIVDGYDGNGLFHMNWGWGGYHDDEYFVLSLADPDGQGIGGSATNGAFQFKQDAFIGVEPGSDGEVLTAQIESEISAMDTKDYTRTNADTDFTEVQFNGAFYARYNIPSVEALNVQVGWALCQNGQIKDVVSSKPYTVVAGVTSKGFYTNTMSTFGAGLALGKYEVCQVYRYTEDEAWSLCSPYWTGYSGYLMAEVTETSLTVRQVQPSFKVNSITVPEYPSTGSALDVTLNVTNDGETFEQVIKLWAQKEGEETWTPVAAATRKIDPGETDDVVLSYMPAKSGTFTLKATNAASDEALKTAKVTIYISFEKTINNIKYVCHSGTKKAKVVDNTISGSTVAVSIPATFEDNGISYTVTEIADRAFMFCFPLASLTIPETVELIGDDAVYNCFMLSEIVIPEGVTRIGEEAFKYCHALKKVSLPSTLLSIGNQAFAYNEDLETVMTAMETPCTIDRSVFIDEKNVESETVEVFTSANLYVPIGKKTVYESIDVWREFPVIYQGEPKDVTKDGITYTYVTGEDFAIVKNGDQAALEDQDVVIPSTILADGKTYKVKKIADYAFFQVNMKSLTIQPGVEEIGDFAFWNAYTIEQIIIPSGVKRIGANVFQHCFYVESIELPASLTSIGEYAFGNNYYLESVVSYITNPFDIADNVFGLDDGDTLTSPTATLTVPAGTKGKYGVAAGWKEFPKTTEMPAQTAVPGDVDCNNEVDERDLNALVGFIMAGEYNERADLNSDKKVNAADIVEFVKISKK